jgi:Glyoxalase-like domain
MSIALLGISVDAVDAARLADFWAQALQRTVDDGATEDFASIAADRDSQRGPFLMFHKVPRARPSRTGCTSTYKPPTSRPKPTA